MVAATQQQQQQQQQQQSQPQISPEEEALKRNTDCVYFLASPLTCKKGSECEYRHSEYARVNPRDCYFWLHGNCLNPKCGFRHPPLDGLLGTQTSVTTGSTFPSAHSAAAPATAATPVAHTSHNPGKQTVPCIFFQKGLCLKGDRCAFMHGPNLTTNKAPQQPAAAPATEPPSSKKAFGVLQKCTQEQKVPLANVSKAAVVPPEGNKPSPKTEIALRRITAGIERDAPPPLVSDVEFPRYKAKNIPPIINGNPLNHSSRLHQAHASDDQVFQHGKDSEEFLRESSPGFDVLVDDELRDSNYYHDEDQYGRTRGHEGRNLNSVNEYEMGHSIDYNSMADIDRETFRDARGYDIDRIQGQYAWEQHRGSSDRVLVGSHPERRSYSKAESPDQINESDLRYRLSKHRRVNGLRSVVSLDYSPDNQVEERSHRNSSRRDLHHLSTHESSLSSRLRGRIKLPRRSPVSGNDLHSEREMDRGRNRGPVSPGKPPASHHAGRLRDRIKGRVEEDYNNIGRNLWGPRMRREIMDDNNADFAGPKSLAELKTGKNVESKEQQFLGKRKSLENNQQFDGELSFKGPMPLSEILKRKRKAEGAASSGRISSIIEEDNNQKESKESFVGSSSNTAVVGAKHGAVSTVFKEVANNKEELKSSKADAFGATEGKNEANHDEPSQLNNGSELQPEEGMIGDEAMEDHELEADDQKDGEYEYEQVDGEYNYEDGENAEAEDEYLDDEDGDDFAKKIGVMFS
ncbi:zinc finger CCCH domain-containing protein 17-like [Pistacia vera]|uniref:zinc finger CCCH domain-containing protein 17-like n=1 Tax=Pistacia vera TaxID=55513 RepID=UPI0012635A92|nr:zinc finger CCCH domain-containing protein 17-like [Pistacia vera]